MPSPPGFSPVALPWQALRLAVRFLPLLVLWFGAGQVLRFCLTWLAAEIGRGSHPDLRHVAVVLLFVCVLLSTATVAVGMLYALRSGVAGADAEREPFFDMLGRCLLPFVIVYVAWGFLAKDASAFLYADVKRAFNHAPGPGESILIPDLRLAWALTALAFVVRMVCERRHRALRLRGKKARATGLLAAFFETAFTLLGISSAAVTAGRSGDWLSHRAGWAGASRSLDRLADVLPGWDGFTDALGDGLGLVKDGLVLPLVWLTIAALVYGAEVHSHRAVLAGTRLEPVTRRLVGVRGLLRHPLAGGSADLRDKYLPLAYAVRLVFRAGVPMFAAFALCYGAAEYVARMAWFGATALIGAQDPGTWHVAIVGVDFGRDLVRQVLRMAVLAAAYGMVARRVSAAAGTPSPEVAESRSRWSSGAR